VPCEWRPLAERWRPATPGWVAGWVAGMGCWDGLLDVLLRDGLLDELLRDGLPARHSGMGCPRHSGMGCPDGLPARHSGMGCPDGLPARHSGMGCPGMGCRCYRFVVTTLRVLLFSLVAFAASPSSLTEAQALTPPPTPTQVAPATSEPELGSLPAQIAGAFVGNVLGVGATFLLVAPLVCGTCEADEGAGDNVWYAMLTAGWVLRPVLAGSFTSLFSGSRTGPGRTYAAILGALPGAVLTSVTWLSAGLGASIPLIVTGHIFTMAGAVAGYRYSARRAHQRRQTDVTPTAFVTPHTVGLTLHGQF